MALKTVLVVASWTAVGMAAIGVTMAMDMMLLPPGLPRGGESLDFGDHILLTRRSIPAVLDYLTSGAEDLFVASESSGDVDDTTFHGGPLPGGADVSVLTGEPEIGTAAVDPRVLSSMAAIPPAGESELGCTGNAMLAIVKVDSHRVFNLDTLYVAYGSLPVKPSMAALTVESGVAP
jgi:hypothetical protein